MPPKGGTVPGGGRISGDGKVTTAVEGNWAMLYEKEKVETQEKKKPTQGK